MRTLIKWEEIVMTLAGIHFLRNENGELRRERIFFLIQERFALDMESKNSHTSSSLMHASASVGN